MKIVWDARGERTLRIGLRRVSAPTFSVHESSAPIGVGIMLRIRCVPRLEGIAIPPVTRSCRLGTPIPTTLLVYLDDTPWGKAGGTMHAICRCSAPILGSRSYEACHAHALAMGCVRGPTGNNGS
jgi:hypothetical protein